MGPLLWGAAVLYFKADNPIVQNMVSLLKGFGFDFPHQVILTIQYRFAVGILILMMMTGLIILLKVPDRFERKVLVYKT